MKLLLSFYALLFSFNYALATVDPPFNVQQALQAIESTYGDTVKIKPKTLAKFGKHNTVGSSSYTTIAEMGSGETNETFVSTNVINKISSSATADTELITIEGHVCLPSGDKVFKILTITLQGRAETEFSPALCRATRAYNSGDEDLVGTIYVYQDDDVSNGVPQTATKVHLTIPIGENQSFKAATSISSKDYWIITSLQASVNEKTGASVDVELQIRQAGGVFRTQYQWSVVSTGASTVRVPLDDVPIIAPKNSDVRLRAIASTTNVSVSGRISGYLGLVQQ